MATKKKHGNKVQYTIRRRGLLPKPIYKTFSLDQEEEGDKWAAYIEDCLDRGLLPPDLVEQSSDITTITEAIRAYRQAVKISEADASCLQVIITRIGYTHLLNCDYNWAESWVREQSQIKGLAPSTIRHHVGALARCFDWVVRKKTPTLPVNFLRQLPKGYATLPGGRQDIERDRRLEDGEEERILEVFNQDKLSVPHNFEMKVMFQLALETAMRMSEIYTLEPYQADLRQRTIFLEKTKNGDKRQVPLSSVALELLMKYKPKQKHKDFLFPWLIEYRGLTRKQITSKISHQYSRVFNAAGCSDFRFHDTRHEATCRLYERTDMTDLEISRVTGHKEMRMLRRYANLRASDLASRLW